MKATMEVLTNADFLEHETIGKAVQRATVSHRFPKPDTVVSTTTSTVLPGGVKLRYETRFDDVSEPQAVIHKCYFVGCTETREVVHIVGPDNRIASTNLLVLFDGEQRKDYFNGSVYDSDGMLIATDAVVFDESGHVTSFPFTERYISPLSLAGATLSETYNDSGDPVVRFAVTFDSLQDAAVIFLLWETMGVTRRTEIMCDPTSLDAVADLPLAGDPTVAPGDWVAIAVDREDRVIAFSSFVLLPRL